MIHLAVIETRPNPYHAPVYRELHEQLGISVTAIYASDAVLDESSGSGSIWTPDLLTGYRPYFLVRGAPRGAAVAVEAETYGLERALRHFRPDAVLLTGYHQRLYRSAFRLAQRQGVPVLFRAESTDHAPHRSLLKSWVRDNALRYVYQRCAALLYVGQRSRAHYLRLGVHPHRLIFSPYAVDTQRFHTDESARQRMRNVKRSELGIADDDFTILFSGSLVARKDPVRIVDAVRQLEISDGARMTIVFAGDGELVRELEIAASIDPPVSIRFAPVQEQAALSALYHAADVLVLPSIADETWGAVVNEALAHGLPAIVSHIVGSMPDLIEEGRTGAVFTAGSTDSLVAALRRTLPITRDPAVRTACRDAVRDYSIRNAALGIAAACERSVHHF